jgi:PIN domain nuclease of toxin-antitoxin system
VTSTLLLDTCAAMWVVDGRLSEKARNALDQSWKAKLPTFVSPITAWEVGVLAARGRFKSPLSPERWFERVLSLPNVRLAEMSPRVLLGSSFLPGALFRDPADRIIAATAREFGFVVMTRDRALLEYAVQGHLHAIEC